MSKSSVSAAPLSSRFEEWFKSQPEAQHLVGKLASGPDEHIQSTLRVCTAKDKKRLIQPLRYDFDSRYTTEKTGPSVVQDSSVLTLDSIDNADRAERACRPSINGVGNKAASLLGMRQPSRGHSTSAVNDEHPHAIALTDSVEKTRTLVNPMEEFRCGPRDQDQESVDALVPKKKSWLRCHAKLVLALCILIQLGVVSLTVSIVLCTQDSKTGHVRDGTVLTGVIGLASIICSVFTGYDILFAEYSSSRHQSASKVEREGDESGAENVKEKGAVGVGPRDPRSRYKITATHLPHNTIYNSRLSYPFNSRMHIDYAERITEEARESGRLTPQSPLPISISHPPQGTLIRWSPATDTRASAQDTDPGALCVPETWAQRLERGVRPRSLATPCLPDVEEVEEPSSAHPPELEIETDGLSRAASRIISIYSSLDSSGDGYQRESVHSIGMSPLSPNTNSRLPPCLYPTDHDVVSPVTPENSNRPTPCTFPTNVVIRVSAASSRPPESQHDEESHSKQEISDLLRLWHQYVAASEGSSPSSRMTIASSAHQSRLLTAPDRWRIASWPPSRPSSRDERNDAGGRSRRDTAWSRVFATLTRQKGEGGLYFSGV